MKTLQDTAADYALSHTDVTQAYIDGYNAAIAAKRPKKQSLDLDFVDKRYIETVSIWINYKKERKCSYTQSGVKTMYKRLVELSRGDAQVAAAIVEQSIANNYQGLFPLKNERQLTNYTHQQRGIAKLEDLANAVLSGHPTA
jgi:hypothetical protein